MTKDKHAKHEKKHHDQPVSQPDPETLHKTDPQDNMKGPVSSLMHNAGEGFETAETKKEADEKKDKNT
jgi:hypothetical protein